MDFSAATTMSRNSEAIMIGRIIMATVITIVLAETTGALPMRVALAVGIAAVALEAVVIASEAAASVVVMVVAVAAVADTVVAAVAGIAEPMTCASRDTLQLEKE
jgi:hypothetical protein